MSYRRRIGKVETGQATPEYVGVVLLVSILLGALLTLTGTAFPGGQVARAVASKLVCAVKVTGSCGESATALAAQPTPLERSYGAELAAMIADRAPTIAFEDDDFVSLPVDFRECRERACADSILHGSLERTQTGLTPTVFTHVVDCRDPEMAAREGYDCSGDRAGHIYLQYWLYYPDSATHGLSDAGYHLDDWESYQVRIDPAGTAVARASSHHGYNGRDGGDVGSDTGWWGSRSAWDTILNELHVAAGSHAGIAQVDEGDSRRLEPQNLRMLPLEHLARSGGTPDFAVTPPWQKNVWGDPESTGT